MATFPAWIKKTTSNNSNLSPRQVATKAYSLAIKKLDKDDKRRRPQYTVRERLLLSNTMNKAEDLLNKRTSRLNRRVLSFESDDDVIHSAPVPAPPAPIAAAADITVAAPVPTPIIAPAVTVPAPIIAAAPTPIIVSMVTPPPQQINQIKNESPINHFTAEQQMVVSLAVVAVAAYSSLTVSEQQSLLASSHDFCRPIMIPSHSMNSITTII